MSWKSLWKDAVNAQALGNRERALEYFRQASVLAHKEDAEEDPDYRVFLLEKEDFQREHQRRNRTLLTSEEFGDESVRSAQPSPDFKRSGEVTALRFCKRCGISTKQCQCFPDVTRRADQPTNFEPGEYIAKRYQVVRILGVGGMAVVYLVRNAKDELMAIKVLNKDLTDNPEAGERFEREAQIIRKMRHPNIISIFDFGKMSDGRSYFVMEVLHGESLLTVLEREAPLNLERIGRVFLQVCDAMAHAHKVGIIHRDLTPSNIMLVSENDVHDRVRIVDFGIAKVEKSGSDLDIRLTQDGQVFGSPAYMSPEQCLGKAIDSRCDIYSIGCVMYHALSGVPPFSAPNAISILFKQVNEMPPAIHSGSPDAPLGRLERIIFKALVKKPEERYQSMSDFESALLHFVVSGPM